MKNMLLGLIAIAGAVFVTSAASDPSGQCGQGNGWAHRWQWQNAHEMRIQTRAVNADGSIRLIVFTDGLGSTNLSLAEETAAIDAALDTGRLSSEVAARLRPDATVSFLGAGHANYMEFDEGSQVLNINAHFRLDKDNNDALNLPTTPEELASQGAPLVTAYLSTEGVLFAKCTLQDIQFIDVDELVDDDGNATYEYIGFSLSLKADGSAIVGSETGACTEVATIPERSSLLLPQILSGDVVDIGVGDVLSVLTGHFD
jgi:hypothetical protein